MALEPYTRIHCPPAGTTEYYGNSYPAAAGDGTFKIGDIVWNTETSAGEAAFWICTTAGSPGTWQKVVSAAV